jgi:hypothetical protein
VAHRSEQHGRRQDVLILAAMMFSLFNPSRLNVAGAVGFIQLSPVAASFCFLSTDGVVAV